MPSIDNENQWPSDNSDDDDDDDDDSDSDSDSDSESSSSEDDSSDSESSGSEDKEENDDDDNEKEDDEEDDEENDNDVDDVDIDYYDYEMGEQPENFEDEQTSSNRDAGSFRGSQEFNDDGGSKMVINHAFWQGREKLIASIVLCWCCLCLIIIAVVVGVLVGGKNRNEKDDVIDVTPMPTPHPTFAPQALAPSQLSMQPVESIAPFDVIPSSARNIPTPKPTSSPTLTFAPTKTIPQTLGIVADQDTFVNLNGDYMGDEHGKMDTFLVQNGPVKDETIPDTVALITFPFDDVPGFGRLGGLKVSAILRLTHVESESEETTTRDSATYTVVRIPESKMAVSYLHGYAFHPPEDDVAGVLVGPKFRVNPGSSTIDIDVTSLLFDYELEPRDEPYQMLLMLQNRGPEQLQGGDSFYSSNTSTPPELLIDFVGGNAANVPIGEGPKIGEPAVEEGPKVGEYGVDEEELNGGESLKVGEAGVDEEEVNGGEGPKIDESGVDEEELDGLGAEEIDSSKVLGVRDP